MPITPETLPRHEVVGLPVRVTDADDPGLVGAEGEVVAETTRTLGVEGPGRAADGPVGDAATRSPGGADRVRQVPKPGTTFEFDLPDGEVVTVEGSRLVARPARRTENTGDSTWR